MNTVELGNELTDRDLHELYNEMLDEIYGTATIAGFKYLTSRALKALDEVAYRVGFDDWLDAEVSDGNIVERNDTYYKPY